MAAFIELDLFRCRKCGKLLTVNDVISNTSKPPRGCPRCGLGEYSRAHRVTAWEQFRLLIGLLFGRITRELPHET